MDFSGSKRFPTNSATKGLALEDYDLVILGDGTGATLAAWTFASQGQRVAVVERKYIRFAPTLWNS
jgi:ribulose 1,5-bisphosphate synthetase/thiazole synthase